MWMIYTAIGLGIALGLVGLYLLSCIRVLNEYERAVIFRLGRAMPMPGSARISGKNGWTCASTCIVLYRDNRRAQA